MLPDGEASSLLQSVPGRHRKISSAHSIQRLYFIPAAGYRSAGAGALTSVGTEGNYRSSSSYAADGTYAHRSGNLNFTAGNVNPLNNATRASALSVRCVQASMQSRFNLLIPIPL